MYLGKDIDRSLIKTLFIGYQQTVTQVFVERKSCILRNRTAVQRRLQCLFSLLNTVDVVRRSRGRLQILANILSNPIDVITGDDRCAAFGAARLATLAGGGESMTSICTLPEILESFVPNVGQANHSREKWERYGKADPALKESLTL